MRIRELLKVAEELKERPDVDWRVRYVVGGLAGYLRAAIHYGFISPDMDLNTAVRVLIERAR